MPLVQAPPAVVIPAVPSAAAPAWSVPTPRFDSLADWPEAARSALEQWLAATDGWAERALPRHVYHVRAELVAAGAAGAVVPVYTRDVNAFDVGFVTPGPLALGHKAVARLVAPDGRRMRVGCRVRRCLPLPGGWFEGYAEFCQPQYSFENL